MKRQPQYKYRHMANKALHNRQCLYSTTHAMVWTNSSIEQDPDPGDMTHSGSLRELQDTVDWIRVQPHATKIVTAGNHDLLLDASRDDANDAKK